MVDFSLIFTFETKIVGIIREIKFNSPIKTELELCLIKFTHQFIRNQLARCRVVHLLSLLLFASNVPSRTQNLTIGGFDAD